MKYIGPRFALAAALTVLATAGSFGQERADFSGGWTASKDVPAGLAAAPSPVFGARFWLEQKGDQMTVVRPLRDSALAIAHRLGGGEVRSPVPGGMCLGDSATITSVAWEGAALVHRIHGTIVPGSTSVTPAAVRHVFRKTGPDTLEVEGVTRMPGQTEPVTVATVYTRMADQPPVPPAPSVKTAAATLDRLQWLSGTWSGASGTATTVEERWTPAGGGSMLAISRTVRNTYVSAFEFLCIAERAGSLVYTAMPNGRTPATDFMLTAIDASSATFENPSHTFPKMIRYALRPDGTLEATISGAAGQKPTTFTFKKQ